MSVARIVAAGDSAVTLRLGDRIDPATNARALALAQRFRESAGPAIRDIVVGYTSVTVYFDPLAVEPSEVEAGLRIAARTSASKNDPEARRVTIPVIYGGQHGPDLSEVAAFASCTEPEVVAKHAAREYRVFMLGFLPGFPYMGVVDERIAMPRRDTPRLVVPRGSVGIAGLQTGVYPTDSPGGWRLIGRTDLTLFDPEATPPTLLQPGDLVRFTRRDD